jgi:hypothetical protein
MSTHADSEEEGIDPQEELGKLFTFNPRSLRTDPGWDPRSPPNPFWFFDKHIDPKLSLLNVKHMPSLVKVISDVTDQTLLDILFEGTKLPLIDTDIDIPRRFVTERNRELRSQLVTNAKSVAELYQKVVAHPCVVVASTLAIYPEAGRWMTALRWSKDYSPALPSPGKESEDYSLRFMLDDDTAKVYLSPEPPHPLDQATLDKMQEASDRCPDLATWEFMGLSEDAEGMLRDMSEVMKSGIFRPEICGTRGYALRTVSTELPPDAKSGPCIFTTAEIPTTPADRKPPRRSARLSTIRKVPEKTKITETMASKNKPNPENDTDFDLKSVVYPALPSDNNVLTTERLIQHVIQLYFLIFLKR